jgi:ABC-type transport system substrate-binding protein
MALATGLLALTPPHSQAQHAAGTRGGSIVVARAGDFDSFDPALAVDQESVRVINLLYSGLIGIRPDGSLFPNLAVAMPDIQDGGRVYTFRLRYGLRFADGTPLTATDVAFSMNHAADPATHNGGVGFLSSIAGYDAVEAGKARTLSGVQVLDALTVRFTLSRPDAIFPYKLSVEALDIVSARQVARYGKDLGKHPLGSGPYRLVSYTPGQRLVLERNPYYYGHDASGTQLPYLDRITWLVNVNDEVAVLMLERGEVDLLADGVPKASYAAVAADPRFGKLLVHGLAPTTVQVGFNLGLAPFTDPRVRRAVAMAINRERIVKLLGTYYVAPSTQRYPRGFDAWDPTYTGVPYDPVAAKALLARAGYPNGFVTTYLVGQWEDPADTVLGQAIQQDLAQIGVTVQIRSVSFATAGALVSRPHTIPLFTNWWYADYPEASDFIDLVFRCDMVPPRGYNVDYFCGPRVDALLRQAESTIQQAPRVALERQIQRIILDAVAVFPLVQTYYVTIKPVRLANFYIHPIWTWDYAYYRLAG